MTAKEYLEQLAQTAGLSQEERDNILKVATANEKFAKGLEEGVLNRSDYSRNMDELRKKQTETQTYYASLLETTNKNQQVVNEHAAMVQRYKAQYGDLDESGERKVIPTDNGNFISKKEYEEELKRRDANYIGLLEVGLDIVGKHMYEFKEPLNIAALKKEAIEKNLSLQQAYDQMVMPRRTEAQAAALKTQLDAARAEGARDFASKHKLPIDSAPREYHVIHDRDPKQQVGVEDYVPGSGQLSPAATRKLRENFADTWNSAQEAGTSSS